MKALLKNLAIALLPILAQMAIDALTKKADAKTA